MRLLPPLLVLLLGAVAPTHAEIQRRSLADIINSLQNGVTLDEITQGILPNFFSWIPTPDKIRSQLGITNADLSSIPLEVLNLPGYANWTSHEGWNLRLHAWAYKQPSLDPKLVSPANLDKAVNVFLPNLNIANLPPNEQANARNLTSAILSLPQENQSLQFHLKLLPGQNFSSQNAWTARLEWPNPTDSRGEIDGWASLPITPPSAGSAWLPDGSQTTDIIKLGMWTPSAPETGNATAYLVPPEGVLVVSDIDDTLRVTKIYQPAEGLLNTFARDFVPWLSMPSVFLQWLQQHPEQPTHFHYLTTTPEQAARRYMDFIYSYYPMGSFDVRPLNFTTVDQTFSIRRVLLDRVISTFPRRKVVLLGDNTNSDIMSGYPAMAKRYGNVVCILIRNVSATDAGNKFPYDTSGFKGLDKGSYMFFRTPEDIAGLDFAKGDCVNASVPMTVKFRWQGLPFGIGEGSGGVARRGVSWWGGVVAVVAGAWVMGW